MQEEAIKPIEAWVIILELWLFVHALSFLNAEHQARKQHRPFYASADEVAGGIMFFGWLSVCPSMIGFCYRDNLGRSHICHGGRGVSKIYGHQQL